MYIFFSKLGIVFQICINFVDGWQSKKCREIKNFCSNEQKLDKNMK